MNVLSCSENGVGSFPQATVARGAMVFAVCALAIGLAGAENNAAAQKATEAVSDSSTLRAKRPSNAQLADPKIEARVEKLLRQMTLEEKLGQLVQYNDTGDSLSEKTSENKPAEKAGVIVAVNPVVANHLDVMQMAATGRVGSMLNTVGQARTNT
jgi:beta-glucosidase